MPLFHFHLRAHGALLADPEGAEFADLAAARAHGESVARELMHNADAGKRHWSLRVEDSAGELQFDVYFVDVDPRLAAYSPQMRMLASQTCLRLGALIDTLCVTRSTAIESRILIARARRRPQLVINRGT